MTLREVYRAALAATEENEFGTREFDLSCLLKKCFGVERYALPLRGGDRAAPDGEALFFALVRRYAHGEPLQYLLGEWAFYGLNFEVGPGVLIPRADTETLVETALDRLREKPNPRVADLCAGSGCIGIAIGSRRPDADICALEREAAAFSFLERNIARNRSGVRAILGDVLRPPALAPFDLLVCNPPYLTGGEMRELQEQVKWEPGTALYGGEDGLLFYTALPRIWRPLLRPGGELLFEVGYRQARAVVGLLEENGYEGIFINKDLSGNERVVGARRPPAKNE